MKNIALSSIICIVLVLAGVFALAAVGFGVRDGLAIKEYKEEDAKAADVVGELEKGIAALKENEAAYLEGVGVYTEGMSEYEAGLKAYEEGKKALEEGRAKVAAGQAQIDANTQAYKEGKELLSKMEPLLPMLNTYIDFRNGSISKLPGFMNAQAWFVTQVRPLAARLGLNIPADVKDFPAYIQNMVAEGKAKLKQYEDGLAELKAGKAELAEGEKQLAEAEIKLAEGEKQLAAGRAELETFENGMKLVDEYTMVCFKNEPIYRYDGDMAVPGPEQRLGADFDWKKYDENGKLLTLRTGEPYLNLDRCLEVCASFRESVAEHVADVTHELYMRLALYAALALAALLAIISGILGLLGKKSAPALGIATAALALACNIFGLLTRYHGYTYPLRDGTYSGTLQLIAIIFLALAAAAFVIVTAAAKKKAAKTADSGQSLSQSYD